MSSGTLSSSPGPSVLQQNSKRALSANSRDTEDRLTKKSRTTSEEPSLTIRESNANSNSTAKDKKKRQRKKKRKVSVVVIEDGRARIKDSSHRGVSRALVPLTPSPVKLGESSRSRSKSVVLVNDERDVEEVAYSSKDKGKGKAVILDEPNTTSAEQEIARLTKELAFKNELIEKHQTALAQTQQSITCQICLELMYNPYALSPCGHLACYDCLLNWFKATPEDRPNPPPPVLVRKKTCPHCRAAITERPIQVWGVKSIVSCFAKSGLLQGNFLSADDAAEASGNSAVVAGEGRDPWHGIFKRKQGWGRTIRERLDGVDLERDIFERSEDEDERGILDHEDGGVYRCYDCLHEIWDGLCSNCGRMYPDVDGDEDDQDFYLESDEDDFGDDGDDVGLGWMAQAHMDFHHALGFDDHQQQQQHEEEPHEDLQARLVEIEAEHAADEGREPDFEAFVGSEGDDDDDGEEDEEYEGSFIDDEHDVGIPIVASSLPPPLRRRAEIIELSSGSEDEEFPTRRSRRPLSASTSARRGDGGRGGASSSRLSPIEVSDDEDEVQEVRRPLRARARGRPLGGRLTPGTRPIVILSDSDDDLLARRRDSPQTRRNATRVESTDEDGSDDGIDPSLALRIAAEERDLYGEDDSITRHRGHRQGHNFAEEEDCSSAVLDDDDADGEDEEVSWGAEHEDDEERENNRESYDFSNNSGW